MFDLWLVAPQEFASAPPTESLSAENRAVLHRIDPEPGPGPNPSPGLGPDPAGLQTRTPHLPHDPFGPLPFAPTQRLPPVSVSGYSTDTRPTPAYPKIQTKTPLGVAFLVGVAGGLVGLGLAGVVLVKQRKVAQEQQVVRAEKKRLLRQAMLQLRNQQTTAAQASLRAYQAQWPSVEARLLLEIAHGFSD